MRIELQGGQVPDASKQAFVPSCRNPEKKEIVKVGYGVVVNLFEHLNGVGVRRGANNLNPQNPFPGPCGRDMLKTLYWLPEIM